jgi:hypothetical protein
MAPKPPIPFPPNDPVPCAAIADPPFEVTANLNPEQIRNIKAWAQEQVNLALAAPVTEKPQDAEIVDTVQDA